jgi:DNA-binding transcriptional regulator GbsR (MarR family)
MGTFNPAHHSIGPPFAALYWDLLHNDPEWIVLSVHEKLLYLYIKAEYRGYGSNGKLRLTYEEITRVTGMGSATISKGLKKLAKDGNFIKYDEAKKGSNKRRTMYTLTWKHDDWMGKKAEKKEAKVWQAEFEKKARAAANAVVDEIQAEEEGGGPESASEESGEDLLDELAKTDETPKK